MAKETVYADGFRFFERKDNQPDFVLGAIVITPETLNDWTKANKQYASDYKGKDQIKFQVKRSRDGKVYVELDTYKKEAASSGTEQWQGTDSDLGF